MRLALLLVLAIALPGCVSLRSFAEIRRALPADRFVRVGEQLVHVEQAGVGEPVLLLHGFGASTYSWRKVMPALAASHRVVAIDLNGFGYTQRPASRASYTREAQAKLVLGTMDALGIDRAHIFGHSYGGGITLYLASRHPERFRTMVLVDSSAPTYSDDRRSRAAAFRPLSALFVRTVALRPSSIRKGLLRSFHDDSLVTPELVRAYLDRLTVEGVSFAFYGLTAPAPPGEPVELEKIDVPALVIWGAHDTLIAPEAGRRASARMPHSEFVLFANSGHIPMEEEPETFLETVLPFLERHGG
ncbi:MAG TPA: alpha/beta hydrolase [Thermoanaerobaculia bacterium]|jgi:pimeloyl-ACP methyl ester carboxylesterase|nr:alpha/beta hydrolase [Thermoanaerobaculia bacterium]